MKTQSTVLKNQAGLLTSVHNFPVIEHTLWECLTSSRCTKLAVETERFHDREISLDSEHGCTDPLLFAEDLTTTLVEHTIDSTDSTLRALDLD